MIKKNNNNSLWYFELRRGITLTTRHLPLVVFLQLFARYIFVIVGCLCVIISLKNKWISFAYGLTSCLLMRSRVDVHSPSVRRQRLCPLNVFCSLVWCVVIGRYITVLGEPPKKVWLPWWRWQFLTCKKTPQLCFWFVVNIKQENQISLNW